MRTSLEVADVFRAAGPAYRTSHAGHLSLHQLKVMSAVEHCRTAALGGHVEACTDCGHWRIAYNSCRNRHCPKCQGVAARNWLAAREADLLPVGYFHVVFTLPAEIAAIAFHNKALVYDLLFRIASETMLIIAADPRHLGARIGITAVLHTWGSAMTHHPHIHMIVPGGGIAPGGERWISARPAFLLPVRMLGALFRRLFLTRLLALQDAGRLAFFGQMTPLADRRAFLRYLSPVRKKRWVVYAKPPFAGPEAVLAYLSRYTHRVAISNSRLVFFDEGNVTFRYKDYRRSGSDRQQLMTLSPDEFIRRFLLHCLPRGFHRIRHYGLLAGSTRKAHLERARQLLAVAAPAADEAPAEPSDVHPPCPCCGGRMVIIETFQRGHLPRGPPTGVSPSGPPAP
ncbi:MAG: IS91 family transposase [Sphingomonadaceae bacterium]